MAKSKIKNADEDIETALEQAEKDAKPTKAVKAGKAGKDAKADGEKAKDEPGIQVNREEWNAKIKDLVKLAQDQGFITHDDINEHLPESVVSPEEFESVLLLLRNMGLNVVESADDSQSSSGALLLVSFWRMSSVSSKKTRHSLRSGNHTLVVAP